MISAVYLPLPDDLLNWQQSTAEFCSYTDSPLFLLQWLAIIFQCHGEFCYLATLCSSGIWKLLETRCCTIGVLLLSSFFTLLSQP